MEKLGGLEKSEELKPLIPKAPKGGLLVGREKKDVEVVPQEG
mgnify:CR=1 FL=1